ncbi:MAG: protein kinase [Casimicrobium sp.]|jgi:serine/threonine protein kinase
MSSPASTASSALPAGSRLGEFEITGVIGEGGFGIVYSARDSSLDRIVAIKEYLPAAFASRNATGMVHVRSEENSKTFNAGLSSFINEARMLAKFSHPGLVEVFRFWEGNGTAYMAMRYYRGVTLREMLRTNPQVVTEQWLCETLDPILLALQELHHEKCYHRDIAPDNILVLPNGRSVLMDFGAARRIIGGMTRALTTVLKPGYAPIEQYSDDGSMAQGAWTDIYAVGGVLYHAMTGKVPVQAISRMMNDPLKPVALAARSEFSPVLTDAVMKCLSVMPENRYQTIDELRAALGWVTTPVSSTVVYARTTMAAPVNNLLATAAASLPPPVAASVAASPAVALDPMAGLAVGTPAAGDALSDLLSAPRGPAATTPSTSSIAKPAQPSRAPADTVNSASKSKSGSDKPAVAPKADKSSRNTLPIALVGVAALLVIGAGAFFFANKPPSAGQAEQPSTIPPVATPTSPSAAPAPVPEAAPAPAPAPVVTDPKPIEVAPPPSVATSPAPDVPVSAPVATGTVTFAIKPWGNIIVDGISKGASPPMKRLALPPGSHTIEIQNPAGATVSRTIEVVSGKSVPVRHAF